MPIRIQLLIPFIGMLLIDRSDLDWSTLNIRLHTHYIWGSNFAFFHRVRVGGCIHADTKDGGSCGYVVYASPRIGHREAVVRTKPQVARVSLFILSYILSPKQ
jgi:hypothetical protein